MGLTEQNAKRLIELLSRGWDGTLTDADNAEIDEFLRKLGPDCGEMLLKVSAFHLELGKHVASTKAYERAMAHISEAERIGRNETQRTAATPKVTSAPILSRLSRRWVFLAIAACLLVAVGVQYVDWTPDAKDAQELATTTRRVSRLLRPSRAVGGLVAVNQAVWAEGSALNVGQTIEENKRLELLSGSAQVSMACGADIVLQGPCSVTLVADDYARLESGRLTAQAAKWATGFVVAANGLEVTDLGTRFAVSADGDGVVEAHVLEGSVLAAPLKKRQQHRSSMLLNSGQAIRVDGIRSKVDLIDARRQDFVDELEQFRPLRPIAIWNTGVGSALGSGDPNWRITSGCAEFGPYPRQAVITEGDTGSYEDNRPEVSQWLSVSAKGYPGVPPESIHTFETTFDLSGFDLETVHLVGHFLVDDAINELRINGHPVKFKRWVTTWDVFDFRTFHPIEITDHFVPGENVISIDVYNSPSNPNTPKDPNPTALRVEWQAFGCAIDK
jgi:hypothetical protein